MKKSWNTSDVYRAGILIGLYALLVMTSRVLPFFFLAAIVTIWITHHARRITLVTVPFFLSVGYFAGLFAFLPVNLSGAPAAMWIGMMGVYSFLILVIFAVLLAYASKDWWKMILFILAGIFIAFQIDATFTSQAELGEKGDVHDFHSWRYIETSTIWKF